MAATESNRISASLRSCFTFSGGQSKTAMLCSSGRCPYPEILTLSVGVNVFMSNRRKVFQIILVDLIPFCFQLIVLTMSQSKKRCFFSIYYGKAHKDIKPLFFKRYMTITGSCMKKHQLQKNIQNSRIFMNILDIVEVESQTPDCFAKSET